MNTTLTTNSFLGLAASGMTSVATKGLSVATAVAVAIVWNDDIGPTIGQPKEARGALLGRLTRRMVDKGMKVSSVDTWRKMGQRVALNYGAEIERIIRDTMNNGQNTAHTASQFVQAVVTWANAKFPNLETLDNDVNGRVARTADEKATAAARKLLTLVNKATLVTLLQDIERLAGARAALLGSHGNMSAETKAENEALIAAIVHAYAAPADAAADEEVAASEADMEELRIAA